MNFKCRDLKKTILFVQLAQGHAKKQIEFVQLAQGHAGLIVNRYSEHMEIVCGVA